MSSSQQQQQLSDLTSRIATTNITVVAINAAVAKIAANEDSPQLRDKLSEQTALAVAELIAIGAELYALRSSSDSVWE